MSHRGHLREAGTRHASERSVDPRRDDFDPDWYVENHLQEFREDDRRLVAAVRDFSAAELRPGEATGIDTGSGPSVIPALTMVPFCRDITLVEPSAGGRRLGVVPGSVFESPHRQWHLGTMFFLAEALTDVLGEIEDVLSCFLAGPRPAAAHAAAGVEGSTGYSVVGQAFWSVPIDAADLRRCLTVCSARLEVTRFPVIGEPLRPGYTGMLLATGTLHPARNLR